MKLNFVLKLTDKITPAIKIIKRGLYRIQTKRRERLINEIFPYRAKKWHWILNTLEVFQRDNSKETLNILQKSYQQEGGKRTLIRPWNSI